MLILGMQRLVVFETPKTGSLALRAMLERYTLPQSDKIARHIGYDGYLRNHAAALAQVFGGQMQTVAVIRYPLSRMQSWYRYRRRPKVKGLPVSTEGVSFEEFMLAYLDGSKPEMANVGRQDRFVGWTGREARVDHLFDYRDMAQLEAFFTERTGEDLVMPLRNATPQTEAISYDLSAEVLARYQAENAEEFALYEAVAAKGYLKRRGLR